MNDARDTYMSVCVSVCQTIKMTTKSINHIAILLSSPYSVSNVFELVFVYRFFLLLNAMKTISRKFTQETSTTKTKTKTKDKRQNQLKRNIMLKEPI